MPQEANPQQAPQAAEDTGQEDLIADVFGLNFADADPADKAILDDDGDDSSAPTPDASVGTEAGAGEQAQKPSSPAPSSDGASAPKVQQEGQKPPEQPASPPQQPSADPRDQQIAALVAQVQALTAQVSNANQPKKDEPAQPAKPQGPQPINVQVPSEMMQALLSEDPGQAHTAMNALVSTIATGMNARFEARVQQLEQAIGQRFDGLTQGQTQREQELTAAQQRDEYFKEFPDHNKPIFQSLLADEAASLFQENPQAKWTPEFRAALGARVNQKLQEYGWPTGVQPAPAAPAPSAPAVPRPAPGLPQGTRPPQTDGTSQSELIADTFAGMF